MGFCLKQTGDDESMQSGFSVMLWKSAFWTVAGLVVLSPLWLWMTFNRLVRSKNRLKEAWSGIEVQLKRRHDLVPVLVSCVKGYQAHERGTLENLTLARSQAMAAQGVEQLGAAENDLSRCLRSVIAVA
jgi:LemA protein